MEILLRKELIMNCLRWMVSTRSSSQDSFRMPADLPQRREKENQLKEIKNHLQQGRQR